MVIAFLQSNSDHPGLISLPLDQPYEALSFTALKLATEIPSDCISGLLIFKVFREEHSPDLPSIALTPLALTAPWSQIWEKLLSNKTFDHSSPLSLPLDQLSEALNFTALNLALK